MNKTAFITDVDLSIGGTAGLVTKVRHKTANDKLVNEFWKNSIISTDSNTLVLTIGLFNVEYNLKFNKVGNKVWVSGEYNNAGGSTITANSILANITSSEFLPKTGEVGRLIAIPQVQNSGSPLLLVFYASGEVRTNGYLTAGTIYNINGWYETND